MHLRSYFTSQKPTPYVHLAPQDSNRPICLAPFKTMGMPYTRIKISVSTDILVFGFYEYIGEISMNIST